MYFDFTVSTRIISFCSTITPFLVCVLKVIIIKYMTFIYNVLNYFKTWTRTKNERI